MSFVRLSDPNLIITAIKQAEDSDDWVITGYNPTDAAIHATMTMPRIILHAEYSGVLEKPGEKILPKGRTMPVRIGARGMVVVRVGVQPGKR
jgi:alpha-mannosidase